MKKTEIKNINFHNQMKGEKIKEVVMVLLLNDSNNKIIYDIICINNKKQLQGRMEEIDNNKIEGLSYVIVTDSIKFIEYKRIILSNK